MEGDCEDPPGSHTSAETISDLRELSIECRTSLHTLSNDSCPNDVNEDHATELMASFNIWAANIGVFREGHHSLVFRLKSAPEICELVRQLLVILKRDTDKALRYMQGQEEISAENLEDYSSDTSSDRSSSPSYQQSQIPNEGNAANAFMHASPIWSSIENCINSLNQLAWTVHRAGTQHRYKRIKRFKDLKRNEQVYQLFERCAREKFDHRFSKASETLRKRMAESIAARWARHLYSEQHQQKLSTLQEEVSDLRHEASDEEEKEDSTARPLASQSATVFNALSVKPSEKLSSTERTKLDFKQPLFKGYTQRPESVLSAISPIPRCLQYRS